MRNFSTRPSEVGASMYDHDKSYEEVIRWHANQGLEVPARRLCSEYDTPSARREEIEKQLREDEEYYRLHGRERWENDEGR
jgi:tryptophan 2,3-dioxygenase